MDPANGRVLRTGQDKNITYVTQVVFDEAAQTPKSYRMTSDDNLSTSRVNYDANGNISEVFESRIFDGKQETLEIVVGANGTLTYSEKIWAQEQTVSYPTPPQE